MELLTALTTAETAARTTGEETARTAGGTTGGTADSAEWITAAEAAQRLNCSVRTVRRWVSTGRVVGKIEGEPGHETRYVRADTLPPLSGEVIDESGDRGDDRRTDPSPEPGQNTARQTDSSGGRPPDSPGECACCRVRVDEVQYLREELRTRNHAEAELRRLLLVSQQTTQQLLDELQQRALPPAVEEVSTELTRRRRWYCLWLR